MALDGVLKVPAPPWVASCRASKNRLNSLALIVRTLMTMRTIATEADVNVLLPAEVMLPGELLGFRRLTSLLLLEHSPSTKCLGYLCAIWCFVKQLLHKASLKSAVQLAS